MIEAAMIWNEPNNKSHWDPEFDPDWWVYAPARLYIVPGRPAQTFEFYGEGRGESYGSVFR